MWKVAPALATGNTFVYKPSPLSPLTAVMLGQVLAEAGLPPGVFGVVQGAGETGALMTKHPGFAKFSFTGSVPTGTKIMQAGQSIFCFNFYHAWLIFPDTVLAQFQPRDLTSTMRSQS